MVAEGFEHLDVDARVVGSRPGAGGVSQRS